MALTLPPLFPNKEVSLLIIIAVTVATGVAVALLPLPLVGLLVAGVFFGILALVSPILDLYLLIFIIPVSSFLALQIGGVRIGVMELVVAFGLVTWLLKLLTRPPDQRRALTIGPLFWPFCLFLAIAVLSWLPALSLGAALVETAKWVEMVAIYLFVINLLPVRQIKWAVAAVIAAGLGQAVIGLYQFVFKVGPEGFLLFDGQFLRAYGTFAQPNPYAGYLGLTLPLAFSLTMWGVSRLSLRAPFSSGLVWLARLALLSLPLILLLAALFASQSRGAWLGAAAATVATLMVRSKKVTLLFAGLLVIGSMIALVSTFEINIAPADPAVDAEEITTPFAAISQRLADTISALNVQDVAGTEVTDANFATLERLAHWQAARDMWRDHPWLGVGFGNYAAVYPAYAVGRWLDPLGHAHNYLLNLGAEVGLIGITGYLIFWICTFWVLWAVVQHSQGFEKAIAAGVFGVVIHLHIHNLVDNLYVQGMYLHIAILLAIITIIYQHKVVN